MLEKLQAKKDALMEEIKIHEEAIAKAKSKMAIVDELIVDETVGRPVATVPATEAPATAEATPNKVVTIRI